MTNESTEPRYQHNAEELRYVANVLDILNGEPGTCGFHGELSLCWCDRLMGRIIRSDHIDSESWVYEPYANPTLVPSEDE